MSNESSNIPSAVRAYMAGASTAAAAPAGLNNLSDECLAQSAPYGTLVDSATGADLRPATAAELERSEHSINGLFELEEPSRSIAPRIAGRTVWVCV